MTVRKIFIGLSYIISMLVTHESGAATISVEGSVGPDFVKEATGSEGFGIPAVLYFNEQGCLVWSSLGLKEPTWLDQLRLVTANPTPCEHPVLDSVLDRLTKDGLTAAAAISREHPVLIWYGNDELCKPCAEARASHWTEMAASVPDGTVVMSLEWR